MKNSFTFLSALAICTFFAFGGSAEADVVNLDFGTGASATFVGIAAAPDAAGATAFWNGTTAAAPAATNLLDSTGAVTAVDIDIDSRGAFAGVIDQEVSAGQADLFGDYLTSRANSNADDLRTGTISGLIPGNSYDLYFYGQGDNFTDGGTNGGQNVGVRIGSDVRHTSWDGVTGGDGVLEEDVEYVLFSSLTANAGGQISFEHFNPGTGVHATDSSFFDSSLFAADPADPLAVDADGNASRFHALNGLQIVGDFAAPDITEVCDVNGDLACNSTDFAILRDNLFTAGEFADGDLNDDGFVDFADFRLFKDAPARVTGTGGSLSASSAVPEPTSVMLLGVCAVLGMGARRSSRRVIC